MSGKPETISDAPTKKAKTRRKRAHEPETIDRFGILLEEAQKFCVVVGLHKDLILEIRSLDDKQGPKNGAAAHARSEL